MNDNEALAAFGLTDDELREELPSVKPTRDGRVCACGHPMSKHQELDLSASGRGVVHQCTPIRGDCRCLDPKPVAEAQDTRQFVWRTRGHGASHALVIGARASAKKEKRFEWLEGWPRCELAGWRPDEECDLSAVQPYGFLRNGSLTDDPEMTVLACRAHGELLIEEGGLAS